MPKPMIAFVNGSLRKESFNLRLGKAVTAMLEDRFDFTTVPIGDLPLYNQDLETDSPPREWSEFREAIASADAVLFGSPEYNRSVTGALKNAIDVGSRPSGKNVWGGKPAGIFSATPGGLGGMLSNHTLRQSCMTLNMHAMAQPEAYWSGLTDEKIGIDGTISDAGLQKAVSRFARGFGDWVERWIS